MSLWSLLLPFKWFIIGVGEVFNGVFSLLKGVVSFLGSLCKYIYKGIIVVSRGIIFAIKTLFLIIKLIAKKIATLLLLLFRGLKLLILGFFRFIKAIILGIFKTLKFVVTYAAIGLKTVVVLLAKGIKYLFTYLYIAIKFLVVNIYKAIFNIFKYLFLGIKYTFIYLYKGICLICKYSFLTVKTILIYIGKALKFIFVDLIYKYIGGFIFLILKGIMYFLNLLKKALLFVLKTLKFIGIGLYQILIYPFVYIYKNFGRIVLDVIKKVKDAIKKGAHAVGSFPAKAKNAVTSWFTNLSFVKDIRNRREMKRQALLIDFDNEDAVRSEKKIIYRYVAKNMDGKIEKGTLGAYSKLDVHSYLLAEGYEVYEISLAKGIQLSSGAPHKMPISDMVFLLTQLATYIKSGIPLVDSIKILGKQSKKGKTANLYKSLIYDLTMGDSFSEALEKQGTAFPKLLVNMVKSSELAGNLSETLDDMAEYYTSVSTTRKQMKSAMTYPTVILVFAMSVVIFILTFVIPSFIQMYKDADAEVPALTTAIINLSDFLINNSIWLIIGVVTGIAGLYYLYKNVKIFKLLVQWIMMHTPIVGKIIIYNEVTMFSKTFASLWNHNVFITSSMEILSKITENEIYKMLIFDAITNVARGETVSSSFKNHWAFPVVAYEMLITGERTGQPGPMMDKVAAYYQEEHRNAINQVKAFIEPALIIVLAAVVGTILLAVVIPMFNIYSQIGLE